MLSLSMDLTLPDKLRLKKIILKGKYNLTVFNNGRGREVYIVGGYVRDALRGLTSPDRDFIVGGDLESFVQELRKAIGGTIVKFKNEGMIRLALKEGLTFDFSRPAGTLREDLSKRDFTVNSIAWSPEVGIIDNHNGLEDIKKKRIRTVSEKNMRSDPLRIIRAYRFAAELNGTIEEKTANILKKNNKRIKEVSPERITFELFNLLNSKHSARYLKMALDGGSLPTILSCTVKDLEHNIRDISKLEKRILRSTYHNVKVNLNEVFSQNITRKGLLCLITLLLNTGMERKEMHSIRLSKRIRNHIGLALRGMKFFGEKSNISYSKAFDLFMKSGEASIDALLIKNRLDLLPAIKSFERVWKKGLLSSEEIILYADLKTGPEIKKTIEKVRRAQFEGTIKTKRQAIDFLKKLSNRE